MGEGLEGKICLGKMLTWRKVFQAAGKDKCIRELREDNHDCPRNKCMFVCVYMVCVCVMLI